MNSYSFKVSTQAYPTPEIESLNTASLGRLSCDQKPHDLAIVMYSGLTLELTVSYVSRRPGHQKLFDCEVLSISKPAARNHDVVSFEQMSELCSVIAGPP